jgi:hypothetical protein
MRQSAFRPFVRYFAAASLWAQAAHGYAQVAEPGASAAVSTQASVHPEFERGLAALQAGRNQEAIAAFEAAFAADGNAGALMNLGIAYTNEGMLNHAVEALTRFTKRADVTREAETIAAVQAEIDRIRSTSGVVVLHVTPENAAVQVDGRMLSPLDGELVMAPGQRHFVVFAEGFVTYDQVMAVAAGRFSLDVALTPVSAAPVQIPAETAVAVAKPPAPASDAEAVDDPETKPTNCALSSVCFGPVLALIGPPNLIGGGLHFRVGEYFGAGVDYQMTPRLAFRPVAMSSSLFSVNARVYPFAGNFFLGGGFGYQSLRGELASEDVTVSANASFPAMMASIGFMGHDGFVMGMDLNVLIPVGSSSVEVDDMQVHQDINGMPIPQSAIDEARGEVHSQVSKIVDALPLFVQLNLLRIGYLF